MKFIDMLNLLSKFFIIAVMIVPLTAFVTSPDFHSKLILTVLLYGIMVERIWFSLFTTKEGKSQKKKTDDWTLILVTYTYLAFLSTLVYDLFYATHKHSVPHLILGIALMTISYVLRSWSVFHLGDQWASHLEITDNSERFLIRTGPYLYMRHPIYTAAIMEFIGMHLLFGGSHSLFFLIWVAIPSVLIRSFYEEKISRRIFGTDYTKYMYETGRFLPIFKKNLQSKVER